MKVKTYSGTLNEIEKGINELLNSGSNIQIAHLSMLSDNDNGKAKQIGSGYFAVVVIYSE